MNKELLVLANIVLRLETSQYDTIMVLINDESYYNEFFKKLCKVLEEENYEWELAKIPGLENANSRRLNIKNNTNQIKIFTLKTIQKSHPSDLLTVKNMKINEGNSQEVQERNINIKIATQQPLYCLLNNMPEEFEKENITIENCGEILNKYSKYIKYN